MLVKVLTSSMLPALLSTAACVVSPYNGQVLDTVHSTFTVSGFGNVGSAQIVVEAKNQRTGAWEQIATTTTAATPIITDRTFPGTNTPNLYYYSIANVAVSRAASPSTLCRWSSTCRIEPSDVDAEVRVRQLSNGGSRELFVGERDTQQCVQARLEDGEDFYASSYECGYDTTVLSLRVIT